MKLNRIILLCLLVAVAAGDLCAGDQRTDIHREAEAVQPLLPGMRAPAFEVRDAHGNPVAFDPDHMDQPIVLTLFRGGWCPYCNLHLAELRKVERELEQMGFDIWFISVDRPELLYESLEQPDIGYVVLSDSGLDATRAFGLAFRVSNELVQKYLTYDIDLEAAAGESHHVLPVPATFIIGADGVIQFQHANPNYKMRLHPDVLLAAARAYADDTATRLIRQREAKKKSE
jgi:peroxiredoxin